MGQPMDGVVTARMRARNVAMECGGQHQLVVVGGVDKERVFVSLN
jgi:hypothetical protein